MTNTELINAYLDNELAEADRIQFEDRLRGDSELQQELALQKDIIEGIRTARTAELKQLLNNVPVGQTTVWSTGKIASVLAVVTIAVIGIIYFNTSDDPSAPGETKEISETPVQPENKPPVVADNQIETADETENPVETTETVTEESVETSQPAVETQPENKRPVVAPSFERDETERDEIVAPGGSILGERADTPTQTDVEIDRTNASYTFHYAFEPGMLRLYGDFNNELYEILEFNSTEGRNWFLEYENKFYYLDDSADGIQPLNEITDEELLNRLKKID